MRLLGFMPLRYAGRSAVPSLEKEAQPMAVCKVCGNDYDKAFTVTMGGKTIELR